MTQNQKNLGLILQQNPKPFIGVISTFARDIIHYLETGKAEEKSGGPAHWIKRIYNEYKVPYNIITREKETTVRVEIDKNGEALPGKIITDLSKIEIKNEMEYDGVIVNILDDFDINDLEKVKGEVLIDIGGFTRTGPWKQEKDIIKLPSKEIREKVLVLKANHEEYPYIPLEWIEEQKKERIMLYTLGRDGVDMWAFGEFMHFDAPPTKVKNVLGAGDTFGAVFLYEYLSNGGDSKLACKKAMWEVKELLEGKFN